MTTAADFTTGDWAVLLRLPLETAVAAAIVEVDGVFEVQREMLAGMKELAAAEETQADNALIQAVLLDLKGELDEAEERVIDLPDADAWQAKMDRLFADARQAAQALSNRPADEALGYKQWLLSIANQAVRATESGGFLGFGGRAISAQEAAFVANLREALGEG